MTTVVVGSETRTHGTNENNGPPFGVAVLIKIVLTQPRRWEGGHLGMSDIPKPTHCRARHLN